MNTKQLYLIDTFLPPTQSYTRHNNHCRCGAKRETTCNNNAVISSLCSDDVWAVIVAKECYIDNISQEYKLNWTIISTRECVNGILSSLRLIVKYWINGHRLKVSWLVYNTIWEAIVSKCGRLKPNYLILIIAIYHMPDVNVCFMVWLTRC